MLIPTYTVRFSSAKQKQLGIAYAEFDSDETVSKVIERFNGEVFRGRVLSIKQHVPFQPGQSMFSRNAAKNLVPENLDAASSVTTEEGSPSTAAAIANKVSAVPEDSPNAAQFVSTDSEGYNTYQGHKLSRDTIFVGRAPADITDEVVREFFEDYSPKQIFIFRGKRAKRGSISFRGPSVSILVQVETGDLSIEDIVESLRGKKLGGKQLILRVAYKDKLEEVIKVAQEEANNSNAKHKEAQKITVEEDEPTTEQIEEVELQPIAEPVVPKSQPDTDEAAASEQQPTQRFEEFPKIATEN